MNKQCGIYKITNVITGDYYIGCSNHIKHRFSQHKKDLRHGRHCNSRLLRDWNMYGEENFLFEITLLCEACELRHNEQESLDNLHPAYNILLHSGVRKRSQVSPEILRAVQHIRQLESSQAAWLKVLPLLSQPARLFYAEMLMADEEAKHKVSETAKFRAPISEETRHKMSEAQTRRQAERRAVQNV